MRDGKTHRQLYRCSVACSHSVLTAECRSVHAMSPDHPKTQKNGDDGDEEAGGYEACPEMTPEQLAKIAEESEK
ncbi:hypothetical protein QR680_015402 [Steinernema hermaphroditum]|uniref:Uncharacterized protein n=1 Tax=Steinernema hermaphroditum TaxID=289476 RepID=A0AA39H8H0_9BILA|nr:hypothetical protein QR680_015402 [Steinernema hermaphroditum]